MKLVRLKRVEQNQFGTFGTITINGLVLFAVELPWKDNANNVSCIPTGKYQVRWTLSPRLKKFTYEIAPVKGRAGIRIHSGNFPNQFLGCIGLGMSRGKMDGQQGVFSSVTAIRKFESLINHKPFLLEII